MEKSPASAWACSLPRFANDGLQARVFGIRTSQSGPEGATGTLAEVALLARLFEGRLSTYSVEKLISCALTILQKNQSEAENQAKTRTLAYIEQLRAKIMGRR